MAHEQPDAAHVAVGNSSQQALSSTHVVSKCADHAAGGGRRSNVSLLIRRSGWDKSGTITETRCEKRGEGGLRRNILKRCSVCDVHLGLHVAVVAESRTLSATASFVSTAPFTAPVRAAELPLLIEARRGRSRLRAACSTALPSLRPRPTMAGTLLTCGRAGEDGCIKCFAGDGGLEASGRAAGEVTSRSCASSAEQSSCWSCCSRKCWEMSEQPSRMAQATAAPYFSKILEMIATLQRAKCTAKYSDAATLSAACCRAART